MYIASQLSWPETHDVTQTDFELSVVLFHISREPWVEARIAMLAEAFQNGPVSSPGITKLQTLKYDFQSVSNKC